MLKPYRKIPRSRNFLGSAEQALLCNWHRRLPDSVRAGFDRLAYLGNGLVFGQGSEAITACSAELGGPLPLSQLSGIVYFYPMSQYL